MAQSGWKAGESLDLEREVVQLALADRSQSVSAARAAGAGLVGGLLLSGVGALAGLLHGGRRESLTIAAVLQDGRRFVATTDEATWREIAPLAALRAVDHAIAGGLEEGRPKRSIQPPPTPRSLPPELPEYSPAELEAGERWAAQQRRKVRPDRVAAIEALVEQHHDALASTDFDERRIQGMIEAHAAQVARLPQPEQMLYQHLDQQRSQAETYLTLSVSRQGARAGGDPEFQRGLDDARRWADDMIARLSDQQAAEVRRTLDRHQQEMAAVAGEAEDDAAFRAVYSRHQAEVRRLSMPERALYARISAQAQDASLRENLAQTLGRAVNEHEDINALLAESVEVLERSAADEALLANTATLERAREMARMMAHVCDDPAAVRAYIAAASPDDLLRMHRAFEGASEIQRIRWLSAQVRPT